jgi:hypothetical protein
MYDLEEITDLPDRQEDMRAAPVIGLLGALWGITGFSLLLGYTVVRLAPIALESFAYNLGWDHWAVLILNTLLMAYLEGYRGFQKGLSPRVAARAKYLRDHPHLLYALLGPLYCIGYFHTTRRRQWAVIILTVGIVILILLVRLLNQPWRGLIDVGVLVGLSWGLVSFIIFSILAFTSETFAYSPEVPDLNP